ncbi:PREDICTED: uncharacterized protein LOC105362027 [Ceratosolen solmsi marchali]|uniref:Uncharacterized protein LOC105362027 n=1 Tax=Ceratosolen solmsi marchali TaxID=326594 RepID=A0AAJ7DV81_9HYME|nr:PREDICTED: uncharacterized protein LOC105362027 [Ceratosolen solmsi marchali]
MMFHACSYFLLFIITVGFSNAQRGNDKFSNQDGFAFPGEADRPLKYPIQPQNPSTNKPSEPIANGVTTEPSIQDYNQCIDNCPVTSEYNPVCGTDNIVYNNPGSLSCARNCGKSVEIVNYGRCDSGAGRG